MVTCIAVDDEPLALELLADNISNIPFLQLEGCCRNALEAIEVIQAKKPDLVFLDIQMPGLSGLQLAEHIRGKAMVIFLSAYGNHALDGYDVNAIDYLLKPVTRERFMKACMKALEWHTLRSARAQGLNNEVPVAAVEQHSKPEPRFLYVYVDYNLVKVDVNDIDYIEGFKDYVKIHIQSSNRPIVTRMSMKLLEEKLAPYYFLRVHKSFIVAIDKISAVQKTLLSVGANEIPVSDSYRDSLMEMIRTRNIL